MIPVLIPVLVFVLLGPALAPDPARADRVAAPQLQTPSATAIPQTVFAPEITAEDLRRHVEILASEAMEGRRAGTEGERRAADYLAAEFARIGLEPAGENGYFQDFEFISGVRTGPKARLTLHEDGQSAQALRLHQDWRPYGSSKAGPSGPWEVVFAGFGLLSPGQGAWPGYDSYVGGASLRGRWALVWRGAPAAARASARRRLLSLSSTRYKASIARSRGAVGLLVADGPGIGSPPGLPELFYAPLSKGDAIPVIAISREAAERLLRAGGADPAALEKARAGGLEPGAPLRLRGVSLSAHVDLEFETSVGRNVVGRLPLRARVDPPKGAPPVSTFPFPPVAPVVPPPVLIGAHLDHLGRGEDRNSRAAPGEEGRIHLGADDNASGVAAMLEIAESLAAAQAAGRLHAARDAVFAGWSAEELGLIGSSRYVDWLQRKEQGPDLSGAVAAHFNMDMVGRLRDRRLEVSGVGSSSLWRGMVKRLSARSGLRPQIFEEGYLPTDATSFFMAGVPVLSFSTGDHPDYHTPRDLPTLLNYPGLVRVATFVLWAATDRIEASATPDFVALNRPRPARRRDRDRVYLGALPDFLQRDGAGVRLAAVIDGGPAHAAGVRGGDRLVGLDGETLHDLFDLVRVLNGLTPGRKVELALMRGEERLVLPITLGRRMRGTDKQQ